MPVDFKMLRKEFMIALNDELEKLGFKKRQQTFYRKTPYGKDMLDITFASYPGYCFVIDLAIGIRYEVVESFLENRNPNIPKNRKGWIETVGNRIDNMLYPQYGHLVNWEVFGESDVVNAVSGILNIVHTIALPLFERFSSDEEMLKILSIDNEEYKLIRGMFTTNNASSALVLAFYLGTRDVFDRVIDYWTPKLQEKAISEEGIDTYWTNELKSFSSLADELKSKWEAGDRTL